jgi:hypothetical protein
MNLVYDKGRKIMIRTLENADLVTSRRKIDVF